MMTHLISSWKPDCSGTKYTSRWLAAVDMLFLAWLVLLLGGCAGAPVMAQQDPTPGVVKVVARSGEDGSLREGSGFVVGFDAGLTFLATAAHVVEGDPHPRVTFAAAPHLTYEASIVRSATDSDIAVLKVLGFVPGTVALPLDERPVVPTDPLQAIGFPRRALQPRWSTAAASAPEDGRVVLDEGLEEGHSGGPLLREGWVVGLVNSTEAEFAYATPASFLGSVLASWKVPCQLQATQRPVVLPEPIRAARPSAIPQELPSAAPCRGEVTSRTGSGQPIRIAASPSATSLLSLPAGTPMLVRRSVGSSGYKWYEVVFDTATGSASGWIQADHVRLLVACAH